MGNLHKGAGNVIFPPEYIKEHPSAGSGPTNVFGGAQTEGTGFATQISEGAFVPLEAMFTFNPG